MKVDCMKIKLIVAKLCFILGIVSMIYLPLLLTLDIGFPFLDAFSVMMYYLFFIPIVFGWSADLLCIVYFDSEKNVCINGEI